MASLTRADVEHVAYLARLGLTGDELTRLEGQLNHILDQYEKLAELDSQKRSLAAQVEGYTTAFTWGAALLLLAAVVSAVLVRATRDDLPTDAPVHAG